MGDKMNILSLLKNAKKMQGMMENAQDELVKVIVTGEAGAGAVSVTMNAKHEVNSVKISPETFEDGREIVEELVKAAMNDACEKAEKATKEKMMDASKMLGGLGGLMGGDDKA